MSRKIFPDNQASKMKREHTNKMATKRKPKTKPVT